MQQVGGVGAGDRGIPPGRRRSSGHAAKARSSRHVQRRCKTETEVPTTTISAAKCDERTGGQIKCRATDELIDQHPAGGVDTFSRCDSNVTKSQLRVDRSVSDGRIEPRRGLAIGKRPGRISVHVWIGARAGTPATINASEIRAVTCRTVDD